MSPPEHVPPLRPPFPGLASYGAGDDDAELFFGRRRERDLIIANLRAARLTVLYGPSGVGKSSLLHAGVVHRLRAEAAADDDDDDDETPHTAVVILDDWTGDPAARLAAQIAELGGADAGDGSVLDAVVAYRERHRGGLLVILDQFEAYLRRFPDPRGQAFDDVIAALARDARLSVRILIAIREDHLADLDRFGGRIPQLLGNVLRLGPLSPAAALEAIEGPVERYAQWAREGRGGREVSLEPGLAEAARDELVALGMRGRAGPSGSGAAGSPGAPGTPGAARAAGSAGAGAARAAGSPGAAGAARAAGSPGAVGAARAAGSPGAAGAARAVGSAGAAGAATSEGAVETAFLQLVMRRLWDEDVVGAGATTIRRATLARLGGAERIVATHLDVALDQLPAAEQDLAADMLRFLVTPSGATACLTARDLGEYTGRPATEVEALAEKLARPPARVLRGVAPPFGGDAPGGYEVPGILAEPALDWRARRVTSRLEGRARRLLLALVAMTAVAIALAAYALDPGPLRRAELATVDARFELRGPKPADPRIAVVTLDAATYASLRDSGHLRATIARGLTAIGAAGPRAIAVGIVFPGSDADGSGALLHAVEGPLGRRLVLATDRVDGLGTAQLLGRLELGDHTTPAAGYDGFPADPGRYARRIRREASIEPGKPAIASLAVATARMAGAIRPADLPATAWIDYRGAAGTFPRIALQDVLAGRPGALAKLRGKVVLVGEDSVGASRTSTPGPALLDGVEIQANAISSALDDFDLRSAGSAFDIAMIVTLGLLALGLALRLRMVLVAPVALVGGAAYCAVVASAFAGGRVVALVAPLLSLTLSTIGVMAVLLVHRRRARTGYSRTTR